jgi:MFS transporter, BCD family, chlorophyll transporter
MTDHPDTANTADNTGQGDLSLARNVKIGSFHIGSSMADILLGGVWNRIAIAELGFGAFPISLLLALRYFLAPLSVWVGQRSDSHPILGYRRTPYIWIGRGMILISLVVIGFATVAVYETGSALGWIIMVAAVILFSIGSAFSGTTFIALIYDVSPPHQKTRAISVVWFFLISGFAISGVLYSVLLKTYTREGFLTLFIVAPLVIGVLWFVSILGEERSIHTQKIKDNVPKGKPKQRAFWPAMREAWSNPQSRVFFWFLGLTTLFFYTQDGILEPFAAQVFNMPPETTNRFSSYWGSMTLVGIIVCLLLARRFPAWINNTSLSRWSVIILGVTFALFALCAFLQIRALVTVGLIVLGVGLGAWTVGTLGLMMDMTLVTGAGLYLSLWTVSETLARGVGTLVGGAIRDVGLSLSGSYPVAYGAVFVFQAAGFLLTVFLLNRVNVNAFRAGVPSAALVAEAAMD